MPNLSFSTVRRRSLYFRIFLLTALFIVELSGLLIDVWAARPRAGSQRSTARSTPGADSSSSLTFSIQVATLSRKANAETLFKKLTHLGYDAYMESLASGSDVDYKIKIGKYSDLSEMNPVMGRLREQGFHPVIAPYTAAAPMDEPAPAAKPALTADPVSAVAPAPAPGPNHLIGAPVARAEKGAVDSATDKAAETSTAPAPAEHPEKLVDAPAEESWTAGGVKALHMLGAFALVVALILGGYLLVKRFTPDQLGRRAKERLMHAMDSMRVGEKQTLVLVEVSGDKYLLASTPNDICLLAKIEPSIPPARRTTAETSTPNPDFALLLSQKKAELAKSSAAGAVNAGMLASKAREASSNRTVGL